MNAKVDQFVQKVKSWKAEISELRGIILQTGLDEDLKWGKPCYSFEGQNIAIIQPFKNCLGMMFFKGVLLKDQKGILVDNGPNSQSARRLEFGNSSEIVELKSTIKAYIKEAVAIEASGRKVEFKKQPEAPPRELTQMFAKNHKLKQAFAALSPGRQRAYILYFGGAKQPATRTARIEKYIPQILAGKGLRDA